MLRRILDELFFFISRRLLATPVSYTDIMFVCSSVTMATVVSLLCVCVGGGRWVGGQHIGGAVAGQSVNLSLSVSLLADL